MKTERIIEIEINVYKAWLVMGAVTEYDRGDENVYLMNEFGDKFFCKCL